MKEKTPTRLSLPGPFTGEHLGAGLVRLVGAAGAVAATEVYLRLPGPEASGVLEPDIARLDLNWRPAGVTVTVSARGGTRRLEADSAIVHQPKNDLYRALPLAEFDRDARRFWWRVLGLMRIPGGRLLLRAIARRRRPGAP